MKLTYCLPSYSRFEGACRAADSCLAEIRSGADAELLILDDASPDGTGTKLQSRYRRLRRVTVVARKKNVGLVANWNDGLRRAKGRFVQFLGDDDQVVPGSALQALEALERHPSAVMLFSAFVTADAQGRRGRAVRPLPGGKEAWEGGLIWAWVLWHFNPMSLCTVLFDRKILRADGGMSAKAWHAADADAILRLAAKGNVVYLDRPLALNGWSGENLQTGMKGEQTSRAIAAIAKSIPLPARWAKAPKVRRALTDLLVARHAADSALRWRGQGDRRQSALMAERMEAAAARLPHGPWKAPLGLARLAAGPLGLPAATADRYLRGLRWRGFLPKADPKRCAEWLDDYFFQYGG